jgi:anaerobic C4-dicarboxylate transporter
MTILPSLLTSVKIFDGSNISDAIVYSNRYSETLSSKLTQLIFAQLLATLSFVVIAALVTAQGKFILNILDDDNNNDNDLQIAISKSRATTKFRKADDPPRPPVLDFTKLIFCICIDILGSANEAIPLAGEFVDVIYAPIAALLLRQLFAGSNVVALLELTEEILPFTDFLPLATICWVVESFYGSGNLARVLRIGRYSSDRENAKD